MIKKDVNLFVNFILVVFAIVVIVTFIMDDCFTWKDCILTLSFILAAYSFNENRKKLVEERERIAAEKLTILSKEACELKYLCEKREKEFDFLVEKFKSFRHLLCGEKESKVDKMKSDISSSYSTEKYRDHKKNMENLYGRLSKVVRPKSSITSEPVEWVLTVANIYRSEERWYEVRLENMRKYVDLYYDALDSKEQIHK